MNTLRRVIKPKPRKSINFSMDSFLKAELRKVIEAEREKISLLKKDFSQRELGTVTVGNVLGGGRGVKYLLWNVSEVDPEIGVTYRGVGLNDLKEELPEFSPEAMLYLFLVGKIPTGPQVKEVEEELRSRAMLFKPIENDIRKAVYALPSEMHSMAKLSSVLLCLQKHSIFKKAYAAGKINKDNAWESTLDDALNLLAIIPYCVALIFHSKKGKKIKLEATSDYASNFCSMLGIDKRSIIDFMKMYIIIHADHEGGNASAHATHLVASTYADVFSSFAAGMTALAGPLHGLACQNVLLFLEELKAHYSPGKTVDEITEEDVKIFVGDILKAKRVVPGYGHAVLRKTDPRFTLQRNFAEEASISDPDVDLVLKLFNVVPEILQASGKVSNPWPNVDAISGSLLQHMGFADPEFYTVLFGMSRSFGVLTQVVWDRALGLPLERPKSVTLDSLINLRSQL